MAKNSLLKIRLVISLSTLLFSCEDTCEVAEIKVSKLLIEQSSNQPYNYCGLLEGAVDNKPDSIRLLSLLEIFDGASYDHGTVLIDVIGKVGESNYVYALNKITPKQKRLVLGYLYAGVEYHYDNSIAKKNLQEIYPKVFEFLTKSG